MIVELELVGRQRWFYIILATLITLLPGCQTQPGRSKDIEKTRNVAAFAAEPFPVRQVNRHRFDKSLRPTDLSAPAGYTAGTIVIDTRNRFLYFIGDNGMARRYGIAVGANGYAWIGTATIDRKARWPAWYPTDDIKNQTPKLPNRIEPGPHNPLGARALYLYQNGVDTLYRIHGTSEPWTIGTRASSGCIRMFNEDIIELYDKIKIGTNVVVI